ncbi:MAG: TerB family tellurite resistance protein [Alphaproteobacteria bacterium]
MGFWGKMLGGVAGFAMGGPLGAMVGAALGHAADAGALGGKGGAISAATPDLMAFFGSKENLFSFSVVVLSAKLAKIDGPIKREEIAAFRNLFHVPEEALGEVGRLFDQARETADGWEPFAEKLGEAFADNKAMLEDVLVALVQIARADGPVATAEFDLLRVFLARFGLDAASWVGAKGGTGRAVAPEVQGEDPYSMLGLTRQASDEEVRLAWRKLMRENHPDSLASRGVPQEFVKRATEQVAQINAAWDRIKRERGL